MKNLILFLSMAWASIACAQFPGVSSYDIETTKYIPQDLQLRRGETKVLQYRFLQDGAVMAIPSTASVLLNYKAIGATGSYNVVTGYVYSATGGTVRALWTSAANPAQKVSDYDVTVNTTTSTLCRAFGRLNLDSQVSIGIATSNAGKVTLIDWQTVINSNLGSAPFTDGAGYVPTGSVDGTTITWDGQLHAIAAAAPDLTARNWITGHTNSLDNPHQVTAAQAGAYPANNPSGYVGSAALAGYVPTSRTVKINGTIGTLTSNLDFTISVTGGAGVVGDYVSNGMATVSGNAISNGAAISLTAANVGALGLTGGTLTGNLFIQGTYAIGVWNPLYDEYYPDATYWASGHVGIVTHSLLNEFTIPPVMSGAGIVDGTIASQQVATATDDAYRNLPGTVTNGQTVTLYSTNASPSGSELVSLNYVNSRLNSGVYYYNSTNTIVNGYAATGYVYQATTPAPFNRSYGIASNNQYVGEVFTPSILTNATGPATVTIYARVSGGGHPTVTIRPELYFTADFTNTIYEAADVPPQTISETTTSNSYQWVFSFPQQTTPVYAMRRLNVISFSGTPTLTLYGGSNQVSTLAISSSSGGGSGTGDGVTGAQVTNIMGGGISFPHVLSYATNIDLSAATNHYELTLAGWTQINPPTVNTNVGQDLVLDLIAGTNAVVWAASISNAAVVAAAVKTNDTTRVLFTQPSKRTYFKGVPL
jgi:hypothetical protein